jgi:cell division transport system permease protein
MNNYLLRHLQTLLASAGQMARAPVATLLTLLVIGITLALPAGLYVALTNIERVSAGWDRGAQISLFLKRDTGDSAALRLASQIRGIHAVTSVDYISREAALDEFRRLSGFGPALNALGSNPLPAVLVVRPGRDETPVAVEGLRTELARLPGVELAELDVAWLKRLAAILSLAERAVWILAILLATAVLLIIGNTIRLAVLNRLTEIEIIQLVGGTPAFVRRPFLYYGLFHGLAGGVFAWFLVEATLLLLSGPARELAGLYGSGFALSGLGAGSSLLLTVGGGFLGWLGARMAVDWQLRRLGSRQP